MPYLFEAAMRNEPLHAVQHLMFFGTAALFWWSLLAGRYGRAGYGVAVLFVFATGLHTGLLGVLLTFARRLWYPIYDARTRGSEPIRCRTRRWRDSSCGSRPARSSSSSAWACWPPGWPKPNAGRGRSEGLGKSA